MATLLHAKRLAAAINMLPQLEKPDCACSFIIESLRDKNVVVITTTEFLEPVTRKGTTIQPATNLSYARLAQRVFLDLLK
jgi:hypothetical protein